MKKIIIPLLLVIMVLFSSCNNVNKTSSNLDLSSEQYISSIKENALPEGNKDERPDDKSTFSNTALKGDILFYKLYGNYIISFDGEEIKIPIKDNGLNNIRDYQIFLSEDRSKLYYNTEFSDKEGRIIAYSISKNEKYDLLDQLGIKINGHISVFSYKDNRIIAVIGKVEKNKDNGNVEKKVTDTLLEIDLSNNSYKFIGLPFTPYGIDIYRGLGFAGENYLLCQSGYLTDRKYNQCTVIIDSQGKIIKELPFYEEKEIYNIIVSPDGKKFTYQLGQTPDSLYLYSIESNQKQNIFDSRECYTSTGIYSYCINSMWSRYDNILYYILMSDKNVKDKDEITREYSLYRYNIKLNK